MTRHKHADLMIAYANDTSLEFEALFGDVWMPVSPKFHQEHEYRIKPKAKKTVTKWQWIFASCGAHFIDGKFYSDDQVPQANSTWTPLMKAEWTRIEVEE